MPELKLGQSSYKGPKLLVLLGGEPARRSVLHFAVHHFVRRVKLWLQEGQEEVEQVDAQSISDCWRDKQKKKKKKKISTSPIFSSPSPVLLRNAWKRKNPSIPMYQPFAIRMRAKKRSRSMAVPAHRYMTNGVDWSRSAWYFCDTSAIAGFLSIH